MTVEERLSKLEVQNRCFKRATAAALVIMGAVLLMAQARPAPPTVEATQIILRDAQGRERVRVAVAGDGNPAVSMLDQQGRLLSSLGPHGISFYDESGRTKSPTSRATCTGWNCCCSAGWVRVRPYCAPTPPDRS